MPRKVPVRTEAQRAADRRYQRKRRASLTTVQRQEMDRARMLYRHGIDEAEFQRMFEAQDGACATCGATDVVLRIDHDHSCCPRRTTRGCGRCVRGLLCNRCNLVLGSVMEDPELLDALRAYLIVRGVRAGR